jgi:hypothetical protein
MASSKRVLDRLGERIEDFLEEFKGQMDADQVVTFEDAMAIIEDLKESYQEDED